MRYDGGANVSQSGSDAADAAACKTTTEVSEDGCHIEMDERCADNNAASQVVGALSLSEGSARLDGTLDVRVTNEDGDSCSSIYDVVGVRL